jgi:hypothetical protein
VAVSPGEELPEQALAAQHSMTAPTEERQERWERMDERKILLVCIWSSGKNVRPIFKS